jgi:Cu(I)/Ag(I) efflux system membrane fusion protein
MSEHDERAQPPEGEHPKSEPPSVDWVAAVKRIPGTAIAVVLAFLAGMGVLWLLSPASTADANRPAGRTTGRAERNLPQEGQVVWTCSMHPQIAQDEPGQCPICSMDLVPRRKSEEGIGAPIQFGKTARRLMQVSTTPVERRLITNVVHLAGTVDYDETRTAVITAWMPGRLERLYVDFTGMAVRKGDHMAELYSPELIAAQEELIQAFKAVSELKDDDPNVLRESTIDTARASRDKLRLLGLTSEQIGEIIRRGEPTDELTIYAPTGGVVTKKHANQGAYVKTGEKIYTIQDLTSVWVKLDAYESDLPWLRLGQPVTFTSRALPGETFEGTISFISPVVDPRSRTVGVRVTAGNQQGKLKPNMFVQATIRSKVARGGRVISQRLADKYICPMHPSVVSGDPGDCTICGMDLETAESRGYVSVSPEEADPPLVVPASAVLRTGQQSVVYVEQVADDAGGSVQYVLRRITLGPRGGEFYIVRRGLTEGERVVTRGNFKIDSERQLRGMTSMMNLPHDQPGEPNAATPAEHQAMMDLPEGFRASLGKVYDALFRASDRLAGDDYDEARSALTDAGKALKATDANALPPAAQPTWKRLSGELASTVEKATDTEDISALRSEFYPVSRRFARIVRDFGPAGERPVFEFRCPMAFDNRGATWLQRKKELRNPYFGSSMLRCGELVRTFTPPAEGDGQEGRGNHNHTEGP